MPDLQAELARISSAHDLARQITSLQAVVTHCEEEAEGLEANL